MESKEQLKQRVENLIEELEDLIGEFFSNAKKLDVKAAQKRARTKITPIVNKLKDFRRASIELVKSKK